MYWSHTYLKLPLDSGLYWYATSVHIISIDAPTANLSYKRMPQRPRGSVLIRYKHQTNKEVTKN